MSALLRWVSVRHLLHEAPRTLLTLAGVALGVGVFVSIRVASHSALASFSETVDAVAGRANLELSAGDAGFDERLFLVARSAPGVRAAAPVIEVHALAHAGPPPPTRVVEAGSRGGWDESLLVLGLDPFSEGPFARYRPPAPASGSRDGRGVLAFLRDPRAVAVTRAFAVRHGLAPGDTLSVLASGVPVVLRVRQVLEDPKLQQAYGGNVAITDIGVAQELFRRAGRLDRVDLIVDPSHRGEIAEALRRRLPPSVHVGPPATRTRQVENMLRAFDLNLTALSFIALFVSAFLIFNAVAMAVLRRRREIGVVRALGATRAQVRAQFLAEGAALGLVGGVLGLALGTLLARGTLGAVARTLSDLYLVRHAERLSLDPATYAAGLALGLGVALVASLAPALEASSVHPGLPLRQGALLEARRMPVARLAALGAAVLAAAGATALWTVRADHPMGGFASAFLVLAGFSLLTPAAALGVETLAGPPLRRIAGYEAALGARYLREGVARTSVVIAALMVAVGMMVALSIMVGSFRDTVNTWITQTVRGDLYVEPAGHRVSGNATEMPPALVRAARALPGVVAVDTFRGARVAFGDRLAFVVGVDLGVQRSHGGLQFLSGSAGAILARARADDGVLVTESFRRHEHVGRGDTLSLDTPSGRVRLPVEGVFYDYSTDAGAVFMDRGLYARLWRDSTVESLALYLAPSADPDSVRSALLARAGGKLVLQVTPNAALRRRVLTVFDQTFQITWALQAIAILVAVLGVVSALTTLILQRGREIGVLRAAGALRAQVRRMVLAESALLGLIGALMGCACGFVLALLLVYVINRQFFGWTIRLSVDPAVFAQALALLVVSAVLAGLVPARLAASRVAAEAMRVE